MAWATSHPPTEWSAGKQSISSLLLTWPNSLSKHRTRRGRGRWSAKWGVQRCPGQQTGWLGPYEVMVPSLSVSPHLLDPRAHQAHPSHITNRIPSTLAQCSPQTLQSAETWHWLAHLPQVEASGGVPSLALAHWISATHSLSVQGSVGSSLKCPKQEVQPVWVLTWPTQTMQATSSQGKQNPVGP